LDSSYSHIYSYINVVFLFFGFPHPLGVSSFSQYPQSPFLPPPVHHQADRIAADIGAELLYICNAEGAEYAFKCVFHQIGLGTTRRLGVFPENSSFDVPSSRRFVFLDHHRPIYGFLHKAPLSRLRALSISLTILFERISTVSNC
jgi:hypothetical protein